MMEGIDMRADMMKGKVKDRKAMTEKKGERKGVE